jgi:O-antigen/teichoic acid export membrane protein
VTDPLQPIRRTSAFRGAILTVGMRWTDRLLGLVSTLILARLLLPEDFGLVAMAMVVAGLLDVLLDLGVGAALIQNTKADSEDFHTAWTLRLCQATVAAIVLAMSAPLAAQYYNDERVVAILYIVAITVFIGGFENIGTVSFQKNMEFGRDFQFFFFKRVVGVAFTISAAFVLHSYWALVFGNLVSKVAGVGISYQMSGFRPRLSFARFSRIWSFSQWNLVATVGHYLATTVGRFVVGRRADATVLGAYTLGEEIALMPTTELLAPLARVMFPVFAAAKHDAVELLRVVRLALSVQALVAIPAGVGVALVARDAIAVLLGEKWLGAIPIAQIIALASIASSLGHSAIYLMSALGRMRTLSVYNWSRVVIFLGLAALVFPGADARGIALSFLGTAFAALVVIQVLVRRLVPGFGGLALLLDTWRPLLSAAIMAAAVIATSRFLGSDKPLLRLPFEVFAGMLAYSAGIVLLWRIAGSPAGAESYILEKVALRRLRG